MGDTLIFGLLTLAMNTVLGFVIKQSLEKFSSNIESKREDDQKFSMIIINFLTVLAKNDAELFEALETGRTNGNLKKAVDRLTQMNDELNVFIVEKASRKQ